MGDQNGSKVVGLGLPPSAQQRDAGASGGGLTGLRSSGASANGGSAGGGATGLTGLGTSGPSTGLTGLGTSGAGTGLTGLGTSGSGTGLTGLGTSGGGSLTGLGQGAGGGLTGLGSGASKPAASTPAAAPGRKAGIQIMESAAERIRKLLADRGTPDAALRIRVRGGGCTGLQYDMEFADEPRERDRVFSDHGVKILVDPKSYIFLIGTELVYESTLLESGFKLQNPNVKKSCGCGESFTV